VDDGTRMMPMDGREWTRIDDTFRNLLQSQGISYFIVLKDLADLGERVAYVRRNVLRRDVVHPRTFDRPRSSDGQSARRRQPLHHSNLFINNHHQHQYVDQQYRALC
jgi:hypothetical protein